MGSTTPKCLMSTNKKKRENDNKGFTDRTMTQSSALSFWAWWSAWVSAVRLARSSSSSASSSSCSAAVGPPATGAGAAAAAAGLDDGVAGAAAAGRDDDDNAFATAVFLRRLGGGDEDGESCAVDAVLALRLTGCCGDGAPPAEELAASDGVGLPAAVRQARLGTSRGFSRLCCSSMHFSTCEYSSLARIVRVHTGHVNSCISGAKGKGTRRRSREERKEREERENTEDWNEARQTDQHIMMNKQANKQTRHHQQS